MGRKIAHNNRTGTPHGIPLDFVALVIEFPDRMYGTWWLEDEGTSRAPEGWYIWIESIKLLGVSHGKAVTWQDNADFECDLVHLANHFLMNTPQRCRSTRAKTE